MPAPSARAWSVAKLTALRFEGDADALAAYVDALVENNRDLENGDPHLLREQATKEIADFLGRGPAEVFVDGLMRHLAAQDPATTASDPAPPDAEMQPAQPDAPPSDPPAAPRDEPPALEPAAQRPRDANGHSARPAPQPSQRPPDDHQPQRNGRGPALQRSPHAQAHARSPPHPQHPQPGHRGRDGRHGRYAPSANATSFNGSYNGAMPERNARHKLPAKPSVIARLGDRQEMYDRGRQEGMHEGRQGMQGSLRDRQPQRGYSRGQQGYQRGPPPSGPGPDLRDRLGGGSWRGFKRPRDADEDQRQGNQRDFQRRRADNYDRPDRQGRFPRGSSDSAGRNVHDSGGRAASSPRQGNIKGNEDIPSPTSRMPQAWGDAKDMSGKDTKESAAKPPSSKGGATGAPPAPPPFGFPPPMMTPEMMMKFAPPFPPGIMPPPLMPIPPPPMGRDGRGGFRAGRGGRGGRDGRGRDGRGRDGRSRDGRSGQTNYVNQQQSFGRSRYSVLAMRNVPEDKLKLPHILKFFEKYGTPDNVQLVTPDRAFIIYSQRDPALAAVNSVDAVMGNRHIRLGWANSTDYDVAGLELTEDGVLKPKTGGRSATKTEDRRTERTERRTQQPSTRKDPAVTEEAAPALDVAELAAKQEREKKAAELAAEEDLKKKRQAIAEARAEQEEKKASLLAKKKKLIEDQKALFGAMEKTTDAPSKLEILKKAKGVEAELMQVNSELKPTPSAAQLAARARTGATGEAASRGGAIVGRGRGRGRSQARFGGFYVDNRPKTLQIMGAIPAVTREMAMGIFHETESAEKVGSFWLLQFPTRRAAESASRAKGPLKRGFGPAAMSQIVQGLPSQSPPPDPVAAFAASEAKAAGADLSPTSAAPSEPAVAEPTSAPVPTAPSDIIVAEAQTSTVPAAPVPMPVPMVQQPGPSAMVIDSAEGAAAPAPFSAQPIAE